MLVVLLAAGHAATARQGVPRVLRPRQGRAHAGVPAFQGVRLVRHGRVAEGRRRLPVGLPARAPDRRLRAPPGGRARPRPPAPRGQHRGEPRRHLRTCARCRHSAKENRVTQAAFACTACGHAAHADVNAAVTILRAGLALRQAAQAA
ncbi:zinc ribbon domain-containing protein [Nonomuraea sp. KM88]|uniref:zinc ribbon domain-containing protein n=1 Tax=Nonomuraea sp. KM88 TaxID=3457427 RepID=UPI003FCE6506